MAAALTTQLSSPVGVELADLIRLKAAGETIKLWTPRVRAVAAGGHLSPFKGRGVEFDESRPYQPGDDLRTIDWRVTARTGKPYTKVFREERNRPVIVWLDLQRSMMFATKRAYKAVVAAELAALIGWSAVGNGDQLGGLVFSESGHDELRPRLGRRAVLRLFGLMTDSRSWVGEDEVEDSAAMDHALLRLTRVARPGSMMFLLSDFVSLSADSDRQIRQLASHGDLFLIHIYDPIEAELPPPGRYRIQMGQRSFTIETSNEQERALYRQRFEERKGRLQALDRIRGVRLLSCSTEDDPYTLLMRYFARA
jgi:uncharacterized protein (DUF58 family)